MKKLFIIFGAISAIFLMVSNATAVPQIHSEPIMKNISDNNQQVTLLKEKLEVYIEKLNYITPNIQPTGIFRLIFDIILAIINLIIDFINLLTEFIQDILQLSSALIIALVALINMIIQFLEWLQGLINLVTPDFIQ